MVLPRTNQLQVIVIEAEDKDRPALKFNVLSAAILLFSIFALMWIFTGSPFFSGGIAAATVFVTAVILGDRLYTNVESRQAVNYLDGFKSKSNRVYKQGFHWIRWTARRQPDVMDFQRREAIVASIPAGTALRGVSVDGFTVLTGVTIFINLRDDSDSISHSLMFRLEEIKVLVIKTVAAWLTDLEGRNEYRALLQNKGTAAKWLGQLFDGDTMSDFEKMTGWTVMDPILDDFEVVNEEKETFELRAKTNAFVAAVKQMTKAGVGANEASLAAQALGGKVKRTVVTADNKYDLSSAPATMTVFAPGSGVGGALLGGKVNEKNH